MAKFPQFVLERLALRQVRSVDHPDADTLTAFGEQRLTNRERGDLLAHLAHCPDCRQVLALSSMAQSSEPVYVPTNERIGKRRWQHLGWAVPLVVACLVIGIVWLPSHVRKPAPQATAPASQTQSPHPTTAHSFSEVTNAPATIPAQRILKEVSQDRFASKPAESLSPPRLQRPGALPNIIEPGDGSESGQLLHYLLNNPT